MFDADPLGRVDALRGEGRRHPDVGQHGIRAQFGHGAEQCGRVADDRAGWRLVGEHRARLGAVVADPVGAREAGSDVGRHNVAMGAHIRAHIGLQPQFERGELAVGVGRGSDLELDSRL